MRPLGERTAQTIATAAELAFSVVSFAEIGFKAAIGTLVVPDDLHAHVVGTGVRLVGFRPSTDARWRDFRCTIVIRSIVSWSRKRGWRDSR